MNEIINKFLLTGDKFITEMHLKDPFVSTYSAFGPFSKHKQKIQRVLGTRNKNYIHKNELDKACFQHDMVYNKYKDLKGRKQSDKVLKDKAFAIASNPKHDGYQRGLGSMAYKFLKRNQKELILKIKLRRINN